MSKTRNDLVKEIVDMKVFNLITRLDRTEEAILAIDIEWVSEEVEELYEELADNEEVSEETW